MIFSVERRLFELFPALAIGVLILRVENTRYGDDMLEATLEHLRTSFTHDKPQDHPHVQAWRQAFGKLGIAPSKYYSSVEALLRRALKGGPFPRVNPIVDLYNAISLELLVPMGGHDLHPIEGDIFLGFSSGGERFTPMDGGEEEVVGAGEVVYKDTSDVLTRRWVWRQSSKDKVTPETRSLFMPVDLMEGVAAGTFDAAAGRITSYLDTHGIGRVVHRDLLTKERNVTEFVPGG
jgi:DNA/RNA-binding domain of Phe-tRNA-synthetase-like protein